MNCPGKVVAHGAISELIAGSAVALTPENLHVLVAGQAIETVYGAGYRLAA